MIENPIPFNKPHMTGKELQYITEAHRSGCLAGDGVFTARCQGWIEQQTGCAKALLTNSCTAALDLAALLLEIRPGEEIIMPSYTFASTANAFVLRGGVPVFVDVRADTLNLDERQIESAITPRTRAIVPVHYAGVGCEMDAILEIAHHYGLNVVEDAAQGITAHYKGRPLGSVGDLGAYSFHETKNVISGEGGCLLVNNSRYTAEAEIIREKGTDRTRFFRGEVDKYTWQTVGSSFLAGELTAAFLWAQLEEAERITAARLSLWSRYNELLRPLERRELLRRPIVPEHCAHNAHMYYVLLAPGIDRQSVLNSFRDHRTSAVFHYVPLHSSPAGLRYGRASGKLSITDSVAQRLIRLPLWLGLTDYEQNRVIEVLTESLDAR